MSNVICVNEWVKWLGDVRRLRSATISIFTGASQMSAMTVIGTGGSV